MYSDEVIIENKKKEEVKKERDIENNRPHYCFDVITENNNNRLTISILCYFSFVVGFMYVFLDHMINHATM